MAKPLLMDELWERIKPHIPPEPPKPEGGRPRIPDRAALTGILFVLKTGTPWEYLPQEMGCGSGLGRYRYVVEAAFDWLFNQRRLRVRFIRVIHRGRQDQIALQIHREVGRLKSFHSLEWRSQYTTILSKGMICGPPRDRSCQPNLANDSTRLRNTVFKVRTYRRHRHRRPHHRYHRHHPHHHHRYRLRPHRGPDESVVPCFP